jgi:hypothetical protein
MKILLRVMTLLVVIASASVVASAQQGPPPKLSSLGTPSRLMLSVKDPVTATAWYARLGFTPIAKQGNQPDSMIHLSDGQIIISLVKESFPSPVLVFRTDNIRAVKDTLEKYKISLIEEIKGPALKELRFRSPGGVFILVRPTTEEPTLPAKSRENPICGKNTELSIASTAMAYDLKFWEELGFTKKRTGIQPYIYALMSDGVVTIGIHDQRDIATLSITYFALDMEQRIEKLRKAGIEFAEEIPSQDGRIANVIIRSEDGQAIFLFEGEQ